MIYLNYLLERRRVKERKGRREKTERERPSIGFFTPQTPGQPDLGPRKVVRQEPHVQCSHGELGLLLLHSWMTSAAARTPSSALTCNAGTKRSLRQER